MIIYSAYFFITIVLSEIILALSAFKSLKDFSLFTVLFALAAGILLGAVCSLFRKRKGRRIFSVTITVLLFLFYATHLVYQHIFTGFLSITQVAMGGDAISTYWRETLIGIGEVKFFLIALLLPLIALIVVGKISKKKKISLKNAKWYFSLAGIGVAAIVHVAAVLCLSIPGTGAYSAYDVYNKTFVLNMSERYFGALQSTRLEIRGLTFGTGSGGIDIDIPVADEDEEDSDNFDSSLFPVRYNKIDSLDFAALAASETNKDIKTLHEYFGSQKASAKNEYTGMFEGYNVIMLCCESFSPYLIDAERTPLLYRMATEGFVFNDYYDTICDNTSNSEYTFLTGLLPDVSLLGKGWWAFYEYNSCVVSAKNAMPITVANMMKKQGIPNYAFHYWYKTYYGRDQSHPNFGYTFYAMNSGISSPTMGEWPTSDLEMLQKTTKYYLTPDADGNIPQFGVYYLTFSGHLEYNFTSNKIAKKNKAVSDGLGLPTDTSAYVSGNQELEYALEYLYEQLEAAGVLENTFIVLTPDHYPYKLGLGGEKADGTLTGLSALAGKNLTATAFDKEFNQYKGCVLMWSASMTKPVVVDVPMCELDILPTVSNLLGLEFDSRLLMGEDVFADNVEHIAVLLDRSFVTDKAFYNANTGEVTVRDGVDPSTVTDAYIQRITNLLKNKFTVSTQILYNDYYSHISY